MSSSAIVDSTGREIKKEIKRINSVRPFGSTILVELLDAQEALGTSIHVDSDVVAGAPQGYVLELGSKLDPNCGVSVGDRIMMQGTYVPVPNFDNHRRKRGIIEIHNIKAIFEEKNPDA